jgi:hypothetical protein
MSAHPLPKIDQEWNQIMLNMTRRRIEAGLKAIAEISGGLGCCAQCGRPVFKADGLEFLPARYIHNACVRPFLKLA